MSQYSDNDPCPAGFHLEWDETVQQYLCKPDRHPRARTFPDPDFEYFDPDELGLDPELDVEVWS